MCDIRSSYSPPEHGDLVGHAQPGVVARFGHLAPAGGVPAQQGDRLGQRLEPFHQAGQVNVPRRRRGSALGRRVDVALVPGGVERPVL